MAYLLRFDGVNDYVAVPEQALQSGDVIEIDFSGYTNPDGDNRYLLDSETNNNAFRPFVIARTDGDIQFNDSRCTVEIDGVSAVSRSTSFPTDGLDHTIAITATESGLRIGRIGSRLNNVNVWNADIKGVRVIRSSAVIYNYDPSASGGTGQLIDTEGGKHGTPFNFSDFEDALIYYDDGGSEAELEIHEFSGSALVNASISASAHKTVSLAGNAQVSALSQSSLSKLTEFSGQSTVNVSSVSLFEKVTTFTGTASVDVTSQSDFSKRVAFSGESTVNVTASGVLFDENFEIHTFAGGATISATASGQAIKVGLVSGESHVNATTTAQAQKLAALSGNAQVTVSTQSAFSKLATLAGNAITRITTAATITKRVLLNGASMVLARVSGTFFNTDSNVETYETTIEGRVKAPLVVKGTIKSLTIQGRVK